MNFLKYGIKLTLRNYDSTTRAWLVYWTQLRLVVEAARRFYTRVDWSTLPGEWQMLIAGAQPVVELTPPMENPYAILYVTEDAPLEVVKAAYKALVSIHHPDAGGSEEAMCKLNEAFSTIRALREH